MSISFDLQTLLQGTLLLAIIILVRKFLSGNVSRKIFVWLWCIAFIRLLLPFSVNIPIGGFFLNENISESGAGYGYDFEYDFTSENTVSYPVPNSAPNSVTLPDNADNTNSALPASTILYAIWVTGTVIMLVYFTIAYFHNKRKFRYCQCINDEKLSEFIQSQGLRRKVKILLSNDIASPMTYGILNPVIVLSSESSKHIELVLKHEIIHIKNLDVLKKAFAIGVLSVFWFNPIVWIAVRMFNEDIEYACDERVVHSSTCDIRQNYALALIDMQKSCKSTKMPLSSGFSKNYIEERIVLIMKANKIKLAKSIAVAATVIAAVGISGFSISSASIKTNDDNTTVEDTQTSNSISSVTSVSTQENDVLTQTEKPDNKTAENVENTSHPPETEVIISSERIVPKGKKTDVVLIGDLSEQNKITTFISADYGCEVYAAQSGLCVYNAIIPDYGFCICLQLDNGGYAYYFSLEPYALVDERNTVTIMVGEMVKEGQLIGYTHENGFYVNDNHTGSGVGYRYTNIKPPVLPNNIDKVCAYLHPYELKSYQERGFVLPDHYQAMIDDFDTFTQTHSPNEWESSEYFKKWYDFCIEEMTKQLDELQNK